LSKINKRRLMLRIIEAVHSGTYSETVAGFERR